jgi:single-stranded DNA-specific DHH superfamily exonuclease
MNGIFVSLGALCLVGLGFYFLNRKIDKRLETSALTQQIQKEVDEILIELNGTTERNIGLIEERIRSLGRLLEQADRKIQVLEREMDKQARSADVYTNVVKKRQQAEAQRAKEAAAAKDASSDSGEDRGERSSDEHSGPKLREKVRRLRDSGMGPQQIAAELGSTVGEVELILSLLEGR